MKSFFKNIILFVLITEAKLALWRYKPKIICITGSVGKTSTKDALYQALKPFTHVRRSDKSYNNEFGVPLSILGLPAATHGFGWIWNCILGAWMIIVPEEFPDWLVLEIGVDRPGDINFITRWLTPDIVVLTWFPDIPVHAEFFSSPEEVAEEKTQLAKALRKNGLLVLNGDDRKIRTLDNLLPVRSLTYGLNDTNAVWAGDIVVGSNTKDKNGITCTVHIRGNKYSATFPHIIAPHHLYAMLAALLVAGDLSFDIPKAIEALGQFKAPPGRMAIQKGINGSFVIDDTYNSSPMALSGAIETLERIFTTGRKIAILGDMLELGKATAGAHIDAGIQVGTVADILVVVGPRSVGFIEGARSVGMKEEQMFQVKTAKEAGEYVARIAKADDIILCKGSRNIHLEEALPYLIKD